MFKRKADVVGAIRVTDVLLLVSGTRGPWRSSLPTWLVDAYDKGECVFYEDKVSFPVRINDKESRWALAVPGQWIVCDPNAFQRLYPWSEVCLSG